jgi:hypothetical protein
LHWYTQLLEEGVLAIRGEHLSMQRKRQD